MGGVVAEKHINEKPYRPPSTRERQGFYNEKSFWDIEESERQHILRRLGVMYQGGAFVEFYDPCREHNVGHSGISGN